MRYVFSTRDEHTKHYRFPTHTNDLVLDRADAETSEVFIVVLEEGEAPPPHKHNDTEQVFYILEGQGHLLIEADAACEVSPGDVVRIPPGTRHAVAAQNGPLRYLAVDCFMGRRPHAEPSWEAHVEVMCQENGWDLKSILAAADEKLKR